MTSKSVENVTDFQFSMCHWIWSMYVDFFYQTPKRNLIWLQDISNMEDKSVSVSGFVVEHALGINITVFFALIPCL